MRIASLTHSASFVCDLNSSKYRILRLRLVQAHNGPLDLKEGQ